MGDAPSSLNGVERLNDVHTLGLAFLSPQQQVASTVETLLDERIHLNCTVDDICLAQTSNGC
ncbi:hypothetical protein [Streptomyces cyaneofuscatus]|uniref:hypothetical protein n=1 Tax=Streptomyces cyaneofuscatus TaxID=66883 RepID=UPI002FEF3640